MAYARMHALSEEIPALTCVPSSEMSLEEYRRRASFDIEALRQIIDEEDGVELKQYIWELLDKDPIFHQSRDNLTIEQEQELTFRRVKRLAEYDIEYFVTPAKQAAFLSALSAFDCSLPVLHGVNNIVSINYVAWAGKG